MRKQGKTEPASWEQNNESTCIVTHLTLWFPLLIRCALGTTSLSSFANCFSLLDGSRLVVTHTFGSLTPACAYSSSMELLSLDVSSSSNSTWKHCAQCPVRVRVPYIFIKLSSQEELTQLVHRQSITEAPHCLARSSGGGNEPVEGHTEQRHPTNLACSPCLELAGSVSKQPKYDTN